MDDDARHERRARIKSARWLVTEARFRRIHADSYAGARGCHHWMLNAGMLETRKAAAIVVTVTQPDLFSGHVVAGDRPCARDY